MTKKKKNGKEENEEKEEKKLKQKERQDKKERSEEEEEIKTGKKKCKQAGKEEKNERRIYEKKLEARKAEIWEATDGAVDVFVAGVGTGGTLTGTSRYIKGEKGKAITSVAVEPAESPVITQALAGDDIQPAPHKIQGIGAGFIPGNLDLELIDRVETVTSEEAIEMAKRLMEEEGILAGISSGAAVVAANRLAELPEFEGKTIVTILPSSGERYLSTALFAGIFTEKENLQ